MNTVSASNINLNKVLSKANTGISRTSGKHVNPASLGFALGIHAAGVSAYKEWVAGDTVIRTGAGEYQRMGHDWYINGRICGSTIEQALDVLADMLASKERIVFNVAEADLPTLEKHLSIARAAHTAR